MKYSDDHGTIKLHLYMNGKNRMLTLWNTVPSITPGKQEILFERFYRADSSHNSGTGGHGIGLSAAKAIVVAHKGRITAKSEDDHSILFTITL
jgi:signal transduction histidine kinase